MYEQLKPWPVSTFTGPPTPGTPTLSQQADGTLLIELSESPGAESNEVTVEVMGRRDPVATFYVPPSIRRFVTEMPL
jgi:hypothetical protein